jgi:hypothetical protein
MATVKNRLSEKMRPSGTAVERTIGAKAKKSSLVMAMRRRPGGANRTWTQDQWNKAHPGETAAENRKSFIREAMVANMRNRKSKVAPLMRGKKVIAD